MSDQTRNLRRVGIDTGGTFTDAVTADAGSGFHVHKVPTTQEQPARAVLQALEILVPSSAAVELVHGTTHATNALLTGRLGRTVVVTTKGMRDVLAIGRQDRDSLYQLEPRPPRPPQPRRLIVEVDERLDADGGVITRLTAAEIKRVVAKVAALKPQAIAIGLLHSYRNDAHEQRLARALARLKVPCVLSSALVPEIREYERLTTAWADAALAPVVAPALEQLEQSLQSGWAAGSRLRVLRSDGGTAAAAAAATHPVHLALSGPAGGLAAARSLADARGDGAVLTLDMGGTSTDVALLPAGEMPLQPMSLGGLPLLARGLPIHSVGTGGGSLVRWDAGGALAVGPASAGAVPGPVCYGRGGSQVTVTDAHLVAGRLRSEAFLGGEFSLDPEAAHAALAALGKPAGLRAEEAAAAVLEIASADMERALRRVSLAEGHDPRAFHLYAFGGAGGLHAAWVAARLGMRGVVIPPHAGAFSALGMLAAPPRRTLIRSILEVLPAARQRRAWFRPLEERACAELTAEGVPRSHLRLRRLLEMHSSGQSGCFALADGPRLLERFHLEHQRRFGYRREDQPVMVASLRLVAEGRAQALWPRHRCRRHQAASRVVQDCVFPESAGAGNARAGNTRAGNAGAAPRLRAAVHARADLKAGARLRGPALVTEYSGTTVVPPAWGAEIDAYGALVLQPEEKQ